MKSFNHICVIEIEITEPKVCIGIQYDTRQVFICPNGIWKCTWNKNNNKIEQSGCHLSIWLETSVVSLFLFFLLLFFIIKMKSHVINIIQAQVISYFSWG